MAKNNATSHCDCRLRHLASFSEIFTNFAYKNFPLKPDTC